MFEELTNITCTQYLIIELFLNKKLCEFQLRVEKLVLQNNIFKKVHMY